MIKFTEVDSLACMTVRDFLDNFFGPGVVSLVLMGVNLTSPCGGHAQESRLMMSS